MRALLIWFAALSMGGASLALAHEATPPTEAAPPVTSQPATEATPSQAPASTPTAANAAADRPDAQPGHADEHLTGDAPKPVSLTAGDQDAALKLREFRAAGYKPESHGSEIWFCRKETVIGSRFEKKVCYTADQLEWLRANAREQVEKVSSRISGDPKGPQ